MTIAPKCDRCGEELTAPGGLMFSPPTSVSEASDVKKYHLCALCFARVLVFVAEGS